MLDFSTMLRVPEPNQHPEMKPLTKDQLAEVWEELFEGIEKHKKGINNVTT